MRVFRDHEHHIIHNLNIQLQTNFSKHQHACPMIPHAYLLLTHLLMLCTALLSLNILPEETRNHQEFEDMRVSPQSSQLPPAKTLNLTRTKKGQETLHFLWKVWAPPGLWSAQWNLLLLIRNVGGLRASQQIQTGTEESPSNAGWSGRLESHGTILT